MKNLLIILIYIPLLSFSQEYSEIIDIPGKNANQLFSTAKEWCALTFELSDNIIQMEDSTGLKIIGKGVKQVEYFVANYSSVKMPTGLNVHFTLVAQFKDNKFKYNIQSTDIVSQNGKNYTYNDLKELATEEGLRKSYKSFGIKYTSKIEKMFQDNLENNKDVVLKIENLLHQITNDLTLVLKKDRQINSW